MRRAPLWIVLVTIYALATAFLGWWSVVVVAALWGSFGSGERRATVAALGAAAGWALLLVVTATQGPVGALADVLADVFGIPASLLVLLTLIYPAVVAASAATLAAALRGALQRRFGRGAQGATR